MRKVNAHSNVADISTKNVAASVMEKHLQNIEFYFKIEYSDRELRIGRVRGYQRDVWERLEDRHGGCPQWIRYHEKHRFLVFSQYKVAKGSRRDDPVGDIRMTIGHFCDGEAFTNV